MTMQCSIEKNERRFSRVRLKEIVQLLDKSMQTCDFFLKKRFWFLEKKKFYGKTKRKLVPFVSSSPILNAHVRQCI